MYIHIHIHTYTHIHIYTYTYIYTLRHIYCPKMHSFLYIWIHPNKLMWTLTNSSAYNTTIFTHLFIHIFTLNFMHIFYEYISFISVRNLHCFDSQLIRGGNSHLGGWKCQTGLSSFEDVIGVAFHRVRNRWFWAALSLESLLAEERVWSEGRGVKRRP